MLSHNSSILYIDLSYNEIDDIGVKRLVHHLKDNNSLQSIDLNGNLITEFGVLYLIEIVNILHCIKLTTNNLGHVGIYLILEAITVPIEHIELCGLDASYSSKSFAVVLDKVRSINFTVPDDLEGCEIICESLADTTVLEQIDIYGISDSNHQKLLNAIGQNSNITSLHINYNELTNEYAKDLAKLIKNNKSLTILSMECLELSPQGFLLIADSLTENTSITDVEVGSVFESLDANAVLEFLYQLKQASTMKCLHLWLSLHAFTTTSDFYQCVEHCIQQINYSRSIKGLDPLELEIH